MTFFCRNLDAEVADPRARRAKLEEFDMPGATGKDGVYHMNGQRGAWFRDTEGNLLAVGGAPGRLCLLSGRPSTPIRSP